jgi:hypothetical protein
MCMCITTSKQILTHIHLNGAMQLERDESICLKSVLCAVADGARQLQQLQIVTRLMDRAPSIRVKDLVWQHPECPVPPAVHTCFRPQVIPTATYLLGCHHCTGLCKMVATMPHTPGCCLYRHTNWQAKTGHDARQSACTRVCSPALPPNQDRS